MAASFNQVSYGNPICEMSVTTGSKTVASSSSCHVRATGKMANLTQQHMLQASRRPGTRVLGILAAHLCWASLDSRGLPGLWAPPALASAAAIWARCLPCSQLCSPPVSGPTCPASAPECSACKHKQEIRDGRTVGLLELVRIAW